MAFRRTDPSVIVDVLTRRSRGESRVRIAVATGLSRKTVARYLRLALREGWTPLGAISLHVLERVERALRPGRRSHTEATLLPLKEDIASWLGSGMTLRRVHEELRMRAIEVSYSSLHRFTINHL